MFENLKTGNIIAKLVKLARVSNTLEEYNRNIKDFIPNNILEEDDISKCDSDFIKAYTIKLNNINYSFKEDGDVCITVDDIIIANGYVRSYEADIETKWYHALPKEMLSQIKEDSKIINQYIKSIKNYMRNNKTSEEKRLQKERKELEKIFCK